MLVRLRLAAIYALMAGFCGTANALLLTGPTNNLSGSGTIASGGQLDAWEFLASPAGGAVTITETPGLTLQGTLSLIDPNGNLIGFASAPGAGQITLLLNVPLALSGVYTLDVTGALNTVGSYSLSVVGDSDASIHAIQTVPEPAIWSLLLVAVNAALLVRARRKMARGERSSADHYWAEVTRPLASALEIACR